MKFLENANQMLVEDNINLKNENLEIQGKINKLTKDVKILKESLELAMKNNKLIEDWITKFEELSGDGEYNADEESQKLDGLGFIN